MKLHKKVKVSLYNLASLIEDNSSSEMVRRNKTHRSFIALIICIGLAKKFVRLIETS